MMKMKRKTLSWSLLLAAALTIQTALPVCAENGHQGAETPKYMSFSGTVKHVAVIQDVNLNTAGAPTYVLVEGENGDEMNLIVSKETYMMTGNKVVEGARFIGFYDADAPALMIYPPQHPAVAAAVDLPEGQTMMVGLFDANLLSADGSLKLNVSDETEVFYQDGRIFEGGAAGLSGRTLAVLYVFETLSIPPQTSPIKIVVLDEKAVTQPPSAENPEADLDASSASLVVNGNPIEANAPFEDEDGVLMVPLRTVAEALGYQVIWMEETKQVMLGNIISLTIGLDYYNYARVAPIALGTAPVLKDGVTYVPLNFFKDVARVRDVYAAGNQIIISDSAQGAAEE